MNAYPIETANERTLSLQAEQVARMRGAARLRVTRGLLWLTLDGQLDDHMLLPGDRFTLGRGARALLQALGAETGVVVSEAAPPWPQRAARALQIATRRFAGVLL
jgi:hypothetical protein